MSILTEQEQATPALNESRRELTALLAGCGIYKPDRVLVSLTGRDRVRWLNSMVSNNIRDLAPGRGVYAFILNPQGHILGDLYVFNRGESLVAEIEGEQADTVLTLLRRYIIMDKVEIEDLRDKFKVISVTGAKSGDALTALALPKKLDSLSIADQKLNDSTVTVVQGDNPCVPNYELWVETDTAGPVWDALLRAGAEVVQEDTVETFRILCGIPKVGKDIRERTLPQETGQERALNFTKGCYIGQEIVERIRSRGAVHRAFVGFEIEGPSLAAGTKIQSEGKDVGEVTSVMAAPLKAKRLALGYLRKEYASGDKELSAGGAKVKPVPLPFGNIF